jgi:hypothetical protein
MDDHDVMLIWWARYLPMIKENWKQWQAQQRAAAERNSNGNGERLQRPAK